MVAALREIIWRETKSGALGAHKRSITRRLRQWLLSWNYDASWVYDRHDLPPDGQFLADLLDATLGDGIGGIPVSFQRTKALVQLEAYRFVVPPSPIQLSDWIDTDFVLIPTVVPHNQIEEGIGRSRIEVIEPELPLSAFARFHDDHTKLDKLSDFLGLPRMLLHSSSTRQTRKEFLRSEVALFMEAGQSWLINLEERIVAVPPLELDRRVRIQNTGKFERPSIVLQRSQGLWGGLFDVDDGIVLEVEIQPDETNQNQRRATPGLMVVEAIDGKFNASILHFPPNLRNTIAWVLADMQGHPPVLKWKKLDHENFRLIIERGPPPSGPFLTLLATLGVLGRTRDTPPAREFTFEGARIVEAVAEALGVHVGKRLKA